jgi:hypothetical protein
MSEATPEARLTQWMLDVGVPPKEVVGVLVSSVGLGRTAQVVKVVQPPADTTTRRAGMRRRRVA